MNSATLWVTFVLKKCREAENLRTINILCPSVGMPLPHKHIRLMIIFIISIRYRSFTFLPWNDEDLSGGGDSRKIFEDGGVPPNYAAADATFKSHTYLHRGWAEIVKICIKVDHYVANAAIDCFVSRSLYARYTNVYTRTFSSTSNTKSSKRYVGR